MRAAVVAFSRSLADGRRGGRKSRRVREPGNRKLRRKVPMNDEYVPNVWMYTLDGHMV